MPEPASTATKYRAGRPQHSHPPPPATPASVRDAAATADVAAVHRDVARRVRSAPAQQIRFRCADPERAPPPPRRTQSPRCCETILEQLPIAPAQTPNRASGKQFPPRIAQPLRNSAESPA